MIFEQFHDNPFEVQISFHKVIEKLEEIAMSDVDYRANYAKGLLAEVAKVPELRDGIKDPETIKNHQLLIRNLLADLFPTALTKNEIKAVTIPFHNITFNYSERFQDILNNAGSEFDMTIRDFDGQRSYIISCCMIMNAYYKQQFDFSKPFFYDIPNKEGIVKHYRILYNADFMEIFPTDRAIEITPEDIKLLMDNFDNFDIWKEKFPPESWILRGFGIMSLFDATTENAISNLKTNLLSKPLHKDESLLQQSFHSIFQSIFNLSDIRIGFTSFDPQNNTFTISPFDITIQSFLLNGKTQSDCATFSCDKPFQELLDEQKYFVISDVKELLLLTPDNFLAKQLARQKIHSAIFAPILKNGKLLGIIEVVSSKKRLLNTVNSHKLDIVLPYITDTIDRYYIDIQNQIDALIQKEYTTIHPSVYWKFRDEASQYINDTSGFSLHEIVFKNVYPLYGQIDIKGSSVMRNNTTQEDIRLQVHLLISIFKTIHSLRKLPLFEQKIFELQDFELSLEGQIKADTEQLIQNYIRNDIHPVLKSNRFEDEKLDKKIAHYFEKLDPNTGMIYDARKKFDATVAIINKKMAKILDNKQLEAQAYYPHYYERFKTDGVEHNLYIGSSITNKADFDMLYLYNLRLWQLQVMCEMERQYHQLQSELPYPMEVASLILAFNLPITIRFRMDEKRFDVDGSYNARYEVVKKRIDKAFIRNSEERITQQNKITIVYTQQTEELEYKRYIKFLQHQKVLSENIEFFEIEDLQGVSGLKAIRVAVLYNQSENRLFSYDELLETIKN
ncbi:MAG: GAF domain-containing protein [Flavobacterium sp.]|nr:GAF domain-containing protein [Flavobacterium sp.]